MSTETAIADYKRFSYRKTAIDVFGYLGISIIWPIFNQFVPLFLQAGNPAIEQQLLESGKEIPAYKAPEAGLCSFAVFTLGIAPGTASIFAGLYYFSSQSAAVSGPTPGSVVVDTIGDQYRRLFAYSALFMALALIAISRVK